MEILSSTQTQLKDWRRQVERIFFESSNRQTFADEKERSRFLDNWTGYYLESNPREIFLAQSGEQVFGYIMGTLDSQKAKEFYSDRLESYTVFADQFDEFPAHLHINCTNACRGRGVGSMLIQAFLKHCQENSCSGVHLVTSPDSRNVGFYRRNGFDVEIERPFKNYPLLFMAQRLTSADSTP